MWLAAEASEFAAKGVGFQEMISEIKTAFIGGINPFKGAVETLTGMEAIAKTLQRTIGSGVVSGADDFRERMTKIYFDTQKLGGTFEDINVVMGSLYEGLGRLVDPSDKVTENMVVLSKSTGVATKVLGGMVADFMRLNFSQEKSGELIGKITDLARKGGVSVNSALTNFQKNFKIVDAYGFKNGVDGLNKMTIKALQLRTTVEDIGAAQLGQTFWDPEKAIEAAAGLSMIGGAVGNLSNPFQLMNMGANNAEKLQEELINLSASAYKVNEATGEIQTNFVAQQRLKAGLDALGKGGEYEKYITLGKEAIKQKTILNEISKSGLNKLYEGEGKIFDEEQQGLIASLSEIGEGGKISLNIPGMGGIADLKDTLAKNPDQIKDALEKYQTLAKQDEKSIAIQGLSIAEEQSIDVKMIYQTLVRTLSQAERQKMVNVVRASQKTIATEGQNATTTIDKVYTGTALPDFIENSTKAAVALIEKAKTSTSAGGGVTFDGLFAGDNKSLRLGKGEVFDFIEEDQVLAAPDIDFNLNVLKDSYLKSKEMYRKINDATMGRNVMEPKELPSMGLPKTESIQKTEVTETKVQKIEGSGTVNINVNITSSGNLADSLFNDRRFKNDLEKEILHVIKHKGTLSVKKP